MSSTFSPRDVCLDTDTGDYYDQICAISQKAINSTLVKVFQQRPPSAGELNWHNANLSDGQLRSTMLAPQIELGVNSTGNRKFTLQVRFDRGRIYFGENTYQTVDGWVVIFNLTWPNQTALSDTAASLEDTLESVDFDLSNPVLPSPGEYSIHRLLAVVASLDWGSPVWELSYLTQQDGTKLTLDNWAKDPQNNALYSQVQEFLREAGSSNRGSFLMQKANVQLPRPKVTSQNVSFPAKTVRLQNYPYIPENQSLETGEDGNPYNCLCFCEVVGDRLVNLEAALPFTGNLAWPEENSKDSCLGTFVYDYRIFPDRSSILTLMRIFCSTTQALLLQPVLLENQRGDGDFTERVYNAYDTTTEDDQSISGFPNDDHTNVYFDVVRQSGQSYEWEAMREAPGSDTLLLRTPNSEQWVQWRNRVTSKLSMTRRPDSATYTILGHYNFESLWDWTNSNHTFEFTENCYKRQVNPQWIMYMDMTKFNVDNRAIFQLTSLGGPSDSCDGTLTLINSDVGEYTDVFTSNIPRTIESAREEFSSKISTLVSKYEIKHSGTSELSFGPGTVQLEGNLLAPINFLEPDASRINWISAGNQDKSDTKPDSNTAYISDTTVTRDPSHLAWTSSVTYDPSTQKVQLGLKGTNNSTENLAFKSICAIFLRMKNIAGHPLWKATSEMWVSDTFTAAANMSILTDKIGQKLNINATQVNNELQFTITPVVTTTDADGKQWPDKFLIRPNGSFTVSFAGEIFTSANAGTYIVQLHEDWAGIALNKPLRGRADTFMVVELKADGSSTTPYVTTQSDADTKRGVPAN